MSDKRYRLTFEVVNPISHPQAYMGDEPWMRKQDIPGDWWQQVQKEVSDFEEIRDQANNLQKSDAEGSEFIRNVHLEESGVSWTEIEFVP